MQYSNTTPSYAQSFHPGLENRNLHPTWQGKSGADYWGVGTNQNGFASSLQQMPHTGP